MLELKLVTDWDDYVAHGMECLRDACYYAAKLCDGGEALVAASLCYNALGNLRFGLKHITPAEESEEMPWAVITHLPHREKAGFEKLPMRLRFHELKEDPSQRRESMKQFLQELTN